MDHRRRTLLGAALVGAVAIPFAAVTPAQKAKRKESDPVLDFTSSRIVGGALIPTPLSVSLNGASSRGVWVPRLPGSGGRFTTVPCAKTAKCDRWWSRC
jgi:hypothetical protein